MDDTQELVDWAAGIMLLPLPKKSTTQEYVLLYDGKQHKIFRKWETALDYYNKLRKTIKQKQKQGPIS